MAHTWDPERYRLYDDERGRPFLDLLARVRAETPRTVVDLGCGPGNLTALLKQRWPAADVRGIDSSAEMIEAADVPGVAFEVGDLRRWTPDEEALLERLLQEGKSGPAIAAQLKRTMAAAEHRASLLRARSAFRAEQAKPGR